MESTAIITNFNKDYKTGKAIVTLLIDVKELEEIEKLSKFEKLVITIKKFFKKRSLDANAYCWVLCDKIAKETSKDGEIITKETIYKDAISNIGVFEPFIVQESTFERFKRIWEKQGLGFIVQEVARKDRCVKAHCYYGSSTYDSKEMSLLIELLIQEAKTLNIETKSQAEINSLLEQWH